MSLPTLFMSQSSEPQTTLLRIAVEGCGHGSLDVIYASLERACEARDWTVASLDFLIICGDFQGMRNERDLNCMSVPRRYRHMGDFHRYYSGETRAPVLTLVVGGNHEASNYFSELYYGGWLAPNIYYLGAAGIVRYGPLRIAGLSGIFHSGDYRKPHHESLPYDRNEIRSVFHVRECDVARLLRIRSPIDICLSHDWPRRIEWFGDYKKLFADRPHFLESVKVDKFGSVPAEQIVNLLRPRYWFAGHMHIKYSAVVPHKSHIVDDIFADLGVPNDLRKQLPKSMLRAFPGEKQSRARKFPSQGITNTVSHFMALGKPGADHDFLELVEIDPCSGSVNSSPQSHMHKPPAGRYDLYYDEEWLSIIRSTDGREIALDTGLDADDDIKHLDWIQTNVSAKGLLKIPQNFQVHAPEFDPDDKVNVNEQPAEYPNNQTKDFCKMLEIGDWFQGSGDKEEEAEDYIVFE